MKANNFSQLIGHLGSDPRVSTTSDSSTVASFSIATDSSFKDSNGQKVERVEWHNVVTFGKLAELVKTMLSKGDRVLVTGSLKTRSFMDKSEIQRYTTEVVANEIIFLKLKSVNHSSAK